MQLGVVVPPLGVETTPLGVEVVPLGVVPDALFGLHPGSLPTQFVVFCALANPGSVIVPLELVAVCEKAADTDIATRVPVRRKNLAGVFISPLLSSGIANLADLCAFDAEARHKPLLVENESVGIILERRG